MSDNNVSNDDKGTAGGEEPFLGSWKTKEDASEGLQNLQTKLSEQGSQANTLQAELEQGKSLIEELQAELDTAEKASRDRVSDRDKNTVKSEQAKINQQIADLDPVDDNYSKSLMSLMGKSNALAAKGQHEETLAAATKAFRSELDDRDVKSAHQSFYGSNPDFKTPEMQARIKDYVAKDGTGMSDPLVAYREIQRDDAVLKAQELETQNSELMERLKLKKGTDETGTVILKSQGDQNVKSQTKLTGADLNKEMMNSLSKLREG